MARPSLKLLCGQCCHPFQRSALLCWLISRAHGWAKPYTMLTHSESMVDRDRVATEEIYKAMKALILHHFWASPFAHKIRLAMGMTNLSWSSVEIPRVPPKPLLMPLTSGYRRTPVLQVGADIYCDTRNIVQVLAEFGAVDRLFPSNSRARVLMFSDWIDQTLFPLAVRIVITTALESAPPEFVKDRGDLYFGSGWNENQLKADLPGVIVQLGAALRCLEDGLAEQDYALQAQRPSYADISIAYLCWFLRGRWELGPDYLSNYPKLSRIEADMESSGHGEFDDMEADDALAIAQVSEPQSPTGIHCSCPFELGQPVSVQPFVDSSDPAVVGRLRYLDESRISIDHERPEVGHVAVHFPTQGYQLRAL